MPSTEASETEADRIAAEIARGLASRRYVPGQKLIEADLMATFKVGRTTIREALKRLAVEGLVTISHNRGARIRTLTRSDMEDIVELTGVLLGFSARRAAERLSHPEHVATLEALLAAIPTVDAYDYSAFEQLRDQLFNVLIEIGGGHEVARVMRRTLPIIQGNLFQVQFEPTSSPAARTRNLRDYSRMIKAILARDAKAAERETLKHAHNVAAEIDASSDLNFAR